MAIILSPRTPAYLRVDWTQDGTLDDPLEDVSGDLLPGVTTELGRDQGRIIGGPKVPTGGWTLTNESLDYSAEYSGSPLHGLVLPGLKTQVGRVIGDATITMNDAVATMNDAQVLMGGLSEGPILTGRIEEPRERYPYGARTVEIAAYGMIERLIRTPVTIGYLPAVRTGVAIQQVFDAVGLTADEIVMDQSSVVSGRELLHWYVDNRSAWDVCREIWATEGPPAALYEDAAGRIHWEGRTYRSTTARWQDVQRTFTDTDATYWYTDIEYEPSYSSIINEMSLDITQKVLGPAAKIWEYDSQISLSIGDTALILARTDDPIVTPLTPAAGTDYILTAGSLTVVSVILQGPRTALITLTAGAGGATIDPMPGNDGLQLRASPLVTVSTVTARGTYDPTESLLKYGRRAPPVEIQNAIWPSLSPADASGLIDGYLTGYTEPRSVLRLTLEAANGLLLYEVLTRQIGDRIHVSDSRSGIDLDVSVEQMTHRIDTLNAHECVLHCERVVELDWARWDVGEWGVDKFGQ